MIKHLLIFLSVFFQTQAISQEVKPLANSVFWKAVSNDFKDTIYLFGTIHMLDQDKYVLPLEVSEALKKSNLAYFEVDQDINPSAILNLTTLKKGSIFDYLNETQADSLLDYCSSVLKIDSNQFVNYYSRFKPFFISQLPLSQVMGKVKSYDMELRKLAKFYQIETRGFETFEKQIEIFDKMPRKLATELIMSTVRSSKNYKEEWQKTQENYLNQELNFFLEEMKETTNLNQFMLEEIFIRRNKNWIKTLREQKSPKKIFIAVGAAHLLEESGLIMQLQKANFTLTPININLKK